MDENKILPYIEPIFRFCCKRLANRCDAEDLASEIVCHVLDGMKKYQIQSMDAWVWRVAHNRYARFIDRRAKNQSMLIDGESLCDLADYTQVDEEMTRQQYESVFRYLHTLSAGYRNIFVDYYIGELSVKVLAEKYALPETTIKWRLNVGRQKIKERIGESKMDRVYQRINWNTGTCNGNFDPDRYLHSQVARAICLAAYETPLTVEEISLRTGIPTMYIEDELPRLEYGDAVCKVGSKYATNFVIFRLQDREKTKGVLGATVRQIADSITQALNKAEENLGEFDFYGRDFGMERLGYIAVPYMLRRAVKNIKPIETGPFPPRKDGGYGWYVVEETRDSEEGMDAHSAGCNIAWKHNRDCIYYYWIWQYFHNDIYNNIGTRWMCANEILPNTNTGLIEAQRLEEDDAAQLVKNGLIAKAENGYKSNFACFTYEQFRQFAALFSSQDRQISELLTEWVLGVRKNFESFVPARLYSQINQWVRGYVQQITGYVIEELISGGVLRAPDPDKPLTDGVFYVEGPYIDL